MRTWTNLKTRKTRGFSLVEMMTVVTIVGILAAAAMPAYFNTVRNARLNAANANARAIAIAVQSVFTKNGSKAFTGLNLSNTTVLSELNNMLPTNDCAKDQTGGGWNVAISGTGDTVWTLTPKDSALCSSAPSTVTLTAP